MSVIGSAVMIRTIFVTIIVFMVVISTVIEFSSFGACPEIFSIINVAYITINKAFEFIVCIDTWPRVYGNNYITEIGRYCKIGIKEWSYMRMFLEEYKRESSVVVESRDIYDSIKGSSSNADNFHRSLKEFFWCLSRNFLKFFWCVS